MIIIPDVHGRDFWEKPVKENLGKEHIVFLGDYLDPYEYEGIAPWEVFPRFEEIIALKRENPEGVTLLLGNHDLHYIDGRLEGGFTAPATRNPFWIMQACSRWPVGPRLVERSFSLPMPA